MTESLADEIRRAAAGMRELTKSGELPAWVAGVADWPDAIANGEPTAGIPLKVARAYLEQAGADELRVRIHQHLRAHPDLTVYEIARALKAAESSVRIRLKAMEPDGEACSTTEKRPGDSRPTTRWTAT